MGIAACVFWFFGGAGCGIKDFPYIWQLKYLNIK